MKRPNAAGPGQTSQPSSLSLRQRVAAVTKPTEHGGWGFTLEPIILGLLVAPTLAGIFFAVAVFIAFLSRQVAKLVAIDRRRKLRNERTILAERVVGVYALIATLFLLLTWFFADDNRFIIPLLMALPFGLLFAYYDLSRPGRTLQAELSGPVALAAVASSLVMLAGWSLVEALPLWFVLAARGMTAVLYVRARLRLDHGRAVNLWMPVLWHLVALVAVIWMAWAMLLPWSAVVAMAVLLVRCVYMLLPQRPRISIKAIGFSELGLGLLTVLLVAIGYWIG